MKTVILKRPTNSQVEVIIGICDELEIKLSNELKELVKSGNFSKSPYNKLKYGPNNGYVINNCMCSNNNTLVNFVSIGEFISIIYDHYKFNNKNDRLLLYKEGIEIGEEFLTFDEYDEISEIIKQYRNKKYK